MCQRKPDGAAAARLAAHAPTRCSTTQPRRPRTDAAISACGGLTVADGSVCSKAAGPTAGVRRALRAGGRVEANIADYGGFCGIVSCLACLGLSRSRSHLVFLEPERLLQVLSLRLVHIEVAAKHRILRRQRKPLTIDSPTQAAPCADSRAGPQTNTQKPAKPRLHSCDMTRQHRRMASGRPPKRRSAHGGHYAALARMLLL